MKRSLVLLTLAALGAGVALGVAARTRLILGAADEVIYMVGARNVIERGTLDTNFFLPYSVVVQGIPHRDVHMPGYVFSLVPFVWAFGPTHTAAVALNLLLYATMILLVFALAKATLTDEKKALVAAALATVLPPFTGYLYVAFPELILTVLLLAAVLVSFKDEDGRGAILAGIIYGLGPLFRENLLLSLPIHVALLPARSFWRRFLPTSLVTLVLVYASFSRGRAILPNNVFPGMLLASLQSESPFASLATALAQNAGRNLKLVLEARPFVSVEDTVLLLLVILGILAAYASFRFEGRLRRLATATVLSFALAGAAVFLVYAVRATGRPWAGVRQFMAWEPLLLIFVIPVLLRGRWALLRMLAVAALFIGIGIAHVDFVNGWKRTDLEEGQKLEAFIAAHTDAFHPKRIVVRANHVFGYGLSHFPVQVIWPLRSREELLALERAIDFDFLVLATGPPLPDVPPSEGGYVPVYADPETRWSIWRRTTSRGSPQ